MERVGHPVSLFGSRWVRRTRGKSLLSLRSVLQEASAVSCPSYLVTEIAQRGVLLLASLALFLEVNAVSLPSSAASAATFAAAPGEERVSLSRACWVSPHRL